MPVAESDQILLAATRQFLCNPDPVNRERLAGKLLAYSTAYLKIYLRRRRFGFDRPMAEIASDISNLEVGGLLRGEGARSLKAGCDRLLRKTRPADALAPTLADATDEEVVSTIKRLLRLRSQQGAILEWKREHPQEANLLRAMKDQIRASPGIGIRIDAAGQLVVGDRSDLSLPPIGPQQLTSLLCRVRAPYAPLEVARHLPSVLVPDGEFGGYCFLMDLVRTVHLHRLEVLAVDASETGGAPAPLSSATCPDGIPLSVKLARVGELLAGWTQRTLEEDRKKRCRSGTRAAEAPVAEGDGHLVDIVVDRILAPSGLGRQDWASLSLAELLRRQLPHGASSKEVSSAAHRADYIIRRLRFRLRKRAAELL